MLCVTWNIINILRLQSVNSQHELIQSEIHISNCGVWQNKIQLQYLCLLKLYFEILTVALDQGDYLFQC